MARNTTKFNYENDYYSGLAKIYFYKVLRSVINLGDLEKTKGLILDFGCGVGHLKKALPGKKVIGYDIISKLSDVKDYRDLKPEKIVLSAVLEHMYLEEIKQLLKDFKNMNPLAELIVNLPTENWISKVAMFLANEPHAHDDHVSKYKQVNLLLSKNYVANKRKYVFFRMAQITKYIPKKNGKEKNN